MDKIVLKIRASMPWRCSIFFLFSDIFVIVKISVSRNWTAFERAKAKQQNLETMKIEVYQTDKSKVCIKRGKES